MKKLLKLGVFISLISLLTLAGCTKKSDATADSSSSAAKQSQSKAKKATSKQTSTSTTTSTSSVTSTSSTSSTSTSESVSSTAQSSTTSSASSASSSSSASEATTKNASSLVNYSDSQVEYARVTEALVHYYNSGAQPVEVSVTKNPIGHQVLPFNGSLTLDSASTTIAFSTDKTMATTVIVTYISNGNGSIYFYKNPNHYQDSRYQSDANWVKSESQKMLNSMLLLSVPTQYDDDAASIIDSITVK